MNAVGLAAPLAAEVAKKASGVGLLIILALVGASIFLFRSMNRQLRKIPATFDPPESERLPEPADPADDALAAARGEVPRADQVPVRPAPDPAAGAEQPAAPGQPADGPDRPA